MKNSPEQAEIERFLLQLSTFFDLYGEKRFTLMGKKRGRTINRAGFRNNVSEMLENDKFEYFVLPSAYTYEICRGFDLRWCTQVLIEKGILKSGTNGKASVVKRFPELGKTTRCYHFTELKQKHEK